MARPGAGPTTNLPHDGEGRRAGGLVHEDYARRVEPARRHDSGRRPARGGELAAHELGDLLDRRVAREARGLPVAAAARAPGDRGHVELVDTRAQADAPGRALAVAARRLPDQDR